jgi:hypothetical protein
VRRGVTVKGAFWHAALVLGLATVLRVAGLAREPLTTNEATTAALAADPVAVAIYKTSLDVHPPLHYVFMNGWTRVFGRSPASLRMPSVIAGSLTALAVWLWARSAMGGVAALVAGLAVALSPFHVHYSQEARFYAFLGLAAAVYCYAIDKLLWEPGRRWWLLTLAAGIVGLYTHYYFSFLALAVWACTAPRAVRLGSRVWLRRWGGLAIGLLACYGPWLPFLVRHARGPGAGSTGPVNLGILQHTLRYFFSYGSDVQPWRSLSFLILLAVLVFGIVRLLWREGHLEVYPPLDRARHVPTAGFLATATLVFVVCRLKPLYIAKGMVIVLPAYSLLVTAAWQRFGRSWARAAFGALVLVLCARGLVEFYTVPRNADWAGAARILATLRRPGDMLFLREGLVCVPLHYYLPDSGAGRPPEVQLNSHERDTAEQVELIRSALSGASRFWFLRGHSVDSSVRDSLLRVPQRYPLLGRWDLRGAELLLFSAEPAGRIGETPRAPSDASDSGA